MTGPAARGEALADVGWMSGAACRTTETGVFFPVTSAPEGARPAKAVCAFCPVEGRCLRYALITNQQYGVWGGLDEHERREARRAWRRQRRRSAPSPTPSADGTARA